MQVREFQHGCRINQCVVVRSADLRRRHNGEEFLKLTVGDRTGTVTAILTDGAAHARELCSAGAPIRVSGRFAIHERYGPQLMLESLRLAEEHEYDIAELRDGPARSVAQMEADLRELLATVHDRYLVALLEVVFGHDSPTWARFREAPAAKHYHQAYRHGLLEHSLSVAQAVSTISATFGGIDREIAVTGALLHDIGKLEAYEIHGDSISMSDDGRLYGEISLGYYRVRRAIEDLAGFPDELAEAVLHIILSHHGSLVHGSPVVPCTREATLVHMIDNLGGKLGSFDRVEKSLASGEQWSGFDKGIGGGAFFAGRAEAERRAA